MQPGLLKSALNLIVRHGINCNYSVVTKGIYNVDTQKREDSKIDYVVKAYRPIYDVKQSESLSTVNKTQSVVLIAGLEAERLGIQPKKGDYITYDGDTVQVDRVMKHWANGKVSLYRLFLTNI